MTWETVRLGEAIVRRGTINPASAPTQRFILYSVPSYDAQDPEIAMGSEIGSAKQVVGPGDVLLCRIVPHIRRAWVVGEHEGDILRQIASTEWIVLRDDRFDPRFLRHLLLSDHFHGAFMTTVAGVGGSLNRARVSAAARIPIPLPPLPEQRRIAAILDEADALRQASQSALARAEEIEDAAFVARFANGSVPRISLGELVTFSSGSTPSKTRTDFWGGEVPWVSPKDMKARNLYDSIDHVTEAAVEAGVARKLPADVVAVVVRGMILAHSFPVARLRVPATINQDMKALLPRKGSIEPAFLAAALRAERTSILANVSVAGHGTRRLATDVLSDVKIPHVSKDSQREFVRASAAIESELILYRRRCTALDELFASLQHRAFRGEL